MLPKINKYAIIKQFLSQKLNFIVSFNLNNLNSSIISKTNLSEASDMLWKFLRPQLEYFQPQDIDTIELAFTQMVQSHADQRRKSGEFYIIHPVAATSILCSLKMDYQTICACLLHDVPEDTSTTLKDLSKVFGDEIVFLIEGVTKLSSIKYKGEDRYAENLRKMFVAMSKDLRVIFIKLADRCHNLLTLEHVKPEKQYRIALESLEIYAPIAERLGIAVLQNLIEETSFKYVYPQQYSQFTLDTNLEIERRHKQLEIALKLTKDILIKNKIPFISVYGRAKKYYSIFRKIKDLDKEIDDLYDLVAIRVVTQKVEDCFLVLAEIQKHFHVISTRYKDYITNPKPNGYQSLHCSVSLKQEDLEETHLYNLLPFEFQIRTTEMHEFAEYGVAAHFAYKAKNKKETISEFLKGDNLKWVKELVEIGNKKLTEADYLLKVKLDLFNDRVFVLTPKNDVIDLPLGASVLDFAYRIHADVGNKASVGLVNGKPQKLFSPLKSGNVVEIITEKRQKPTSDWLNWVITKSAKHAIKAQLRKA